MSGSFVSGKIPKPTADINQVKNSLEQLGYTVYETPNHFQFEKEGMLEQVLEEVSPICQQAGISEEVELSLEETYSDLAMTSVYDHGRIIRKLPGY